MECKINVFSSRACELGTKSCTVYHHPLACPCGWTGQFEDLVKNGTVTHADEWYECPSCKQDASKMTRLRNI